MRTGNTMDGMYFLLLFVPVILGILLGDYLRRKALPVLVLERCRSHHASVLAGIAIETITIITGIIIGFLLVKII